MVPGSNVHGVDYLQRMLSTVFVFIPHGDSRWNLRTVEVLSVGAVPVFVADGMTLPFEQVIPWGEFAVRIPECVAATRHAATILQRLRLSRSELKYRSALGVRRLPDLLIDTGAARPLALSLCRPHPV